MTLYASSIFRDSTTRMQPCKFFLQSRCTKGASCPYRHDIATTVPATAYADPKIPSTNKDRKLCRYFQLGICRNGDSCAFSHALGPAPAYTEPPSAEREELLQDSRSLVTCNFYLRGKCRNGSNCPYNHPEGNGDANNDMNETAVCKSV